MSLLLGAAVHISNREFLTRQIKSLLLGCPSDFKLKIHKPLLCFPSHSLSLSVVSWLPSKDDGFFSLDFLMDEDKDNQNFVVV